MHNRFWRRGAAPILPLFLTVVAVGALVASLIYNQQTRVYRSRAAGCSGIGYNLKPAPPEVPNSTVSVNINRTGATPCSGNWDYVGLKLDGVNQNIRLCYADGSNCSEGYHSIITSGAAGTHTLQFTVNNGACLCNSTTFQTQTTTTTAPSPSAACSAGYICASATDFSCQMGYVSKCMASINNACGDFKQCCTCVRSATPTRTPTPGSLPNCNATLSPASVNLAVGGTQTLTATCTGLSAGASIVRANFNSIGTDVISVSPLSDTTSPYNTVATGVGIGRMSGGLQVDFYLSAPGYSSYLCPNCSAYSDGSVTASIPTRTPTPPCKPSGQSCNTSSNCCSNNCVSGICRSCTAEVCDGIDNDCDGSIDEGISCPAATRTPTPRRTRTPTPGRATATRTPTPRGPTATRTPTPRGGTPTRTPTPRGPTPTRTRTPTPGRATATRTPTPRGPTATRTPTPRAGTPTRTPTPGRATATRTPTPRGPTSTRTPTPRAGTPTRTRTPTPGGPTATRTPTPPVGNAARLRFRLQLPDIAATTSNINAADVLVEVRDGTTTADFTHINLVRTGNYYQTPSDASFSLIQNKTYSIFVKTHVSLGRLFTGVNLRQAQTLDCTVTTNSNCGELISQRDSKPLASGDSDGFITTSGSYNKVDSADLQVLAAHFNAPASGAGTAADYNLDGNVDIADLEILGKNYGQQGD